MTSEVTSSVYNADSPLNDCQGCGDKTKPAYSRYEQSWEFNRSSTSVFVGVYTCTTAFDIVTSLPFIRTKYVEINFFSSSESVSFGYTKC